MAEMTDDELVEALGLTPLLRADALDEDSEDTESPVVGETPEDGATVEPKMVPVVVSGVLHGYREE